MTSKFNVIWGNKGLKMNMHIGTVEDIFYFSVDGKFLPEKDATGTPAHTIYWFLKELRLFTSNKKINERNIWCFTYFIEEKMENSPNMCRRTFGSSITMKRINNKYYNFTFSKNGNVLCEAELSFYQTCEELIINGEQILMKCEEYDPNSFWTMSLRAEIREAKKYITKFEDL